MRYCYKFKRDRKYLNQIDQIIIKYHPSNNLINFLQEHQNQRIIFDIEDASILFDQKEFQVFKMLKRMDEKYQNWVLRFPNYIEIPLAENRIKLLQQENIPFFFNTCIGTWDMLEGFVQLGVSDIYIVNELAFELDRVENRLHKENIKIRVYPNIAQASWRNIPDLKKFFIRPEDIQNYEEYVDVCEFYETDEMKSIQLDVLYKAYAIDKRWFGRLKQIILDFDAELDGRYTHPLWISRRIRCGKKCFKGYMCDLCTTIAEFGKTLEKARITIEKPAKEKQKLTEEEFEKLENKYYNEEKIISSEKISETINQIQKDAFNKR